MKKLLFILGVGLVLSACNSSNSEVQDDAEEVAEATETSAKYVIDPAASTLQYKGEKITGSYHDGTVAIKSGHLDVENDMITAGNFTIDMSTITVANIEDEDSRKKFLGHMQSPDFFNVAEYPTATFAVTSATKDSVRGNLTIKDHTHVVTWPYTQSINGDELTISSSFDVDRSKYDVRYGSDAFFDDLGDNLIKNDIEFKVELKAKK
ncbi:YceI family protein [bacterium]|nr:YceI family protein [bacterium]